MWIDPKLAEQISHSIKKIDEFEVTERGMSLKYSFRYIACENVQIFFVVYL